VAEPAATPIPGPAGDPVAGDDPMTTLPGQPPSDGGVATRSPGLREALLVGELVVVGVLLAGAATYLLPGDLKDVVLRTPLLILVLLVGTAAVLLRIARPGRPDR
jgi:hypothetical protein